MAIDYTDLAMRWTAGSEYRAFRPIRCVVDVPRFEEAYRRHRLHLPNDQDPTAWKCERFAQFAATRPPEAIDAPTVLFRHTADGVQARFIQGRHRYRVVRDAGCKEIVVVTWGRKSLWFGMTRNIIVRCLDEVGHIRPVKIRNAA